MRAVDRSIHYSEPASWQVAIVMDPCVEAMGAALGAMGTTGEFVGRSAALQRAQEQIAEVAGTDVSVLITGETGTGKGLAARTLHGPSARQAGAFIQVNCGAVPDGLVESELFGHERGAFTGADTRKLGRVELAAADTLFLDEIGDLPGEAQVKLLRFLDEWHRDPEAGRAHRGGHESRPAADGE